MAEDTYLDESCANCAFLSADDTCGNAASVYVGREVVYRNGDEVEQAAWCEHWAIVRTPTV